MICIEVGTKKKNTSKGGGAMERKYLLELLFNIDCLVNLIFLLSVTAFGLTGFWLLFCSDGAGAEKIACAKDGLRYAAAIAILCMPLMLLIPRRKHLKKMLGLDKDQPEIPGSKDEAGQK